MIMTQILRLRDSDLGLEKFREINMFEEFFCPFELPGGSAEGTKNGFWRTPGRSRRMMRREGMWMWRADEGGGAGGGGGGGSGRK